MKYDWLYCMITLILIFIFLYPTPHKKLTIKLGQLKLNLLYS